MNKKKVTTIAAGIVALSFAASSVFAQPGSGEQGSKNGQPFQSLNAKIEATVAELDALSVDVEALQTDVDLLESTIDAMSDQLLALQQDTEANADAIAALEAQIADVETELLSKQDAIAGGCPADSTYDFIHPDGSYTCSSAPDLQTLVRFSPYISVRRNSREYRVSASCPAGYQAVGGGHLSLYTTASVYTITKSYVVGNRYLVGAINRVSPRGIERLRAQVVCARLN